MNPKTTIGWCVLLLAGTLTCTASAEESKQYEDAMEGYSLRIPAGAQRLDITREQRRNGRIAQWVIGDEQTGQTQWALSVDRLSFPAVHADMEAWLTAEIGQWLRTEAPVEVASSQTQRISGYPALVLRGTIKSVAPADENEEKAPALQARQAWVQIRTRSLPHPELEPPAKLQITDFLVFRLTALPDGNVDRSWARLLENITITDPTQALEEMNQAVENAVNIIAEIRLRETLADVLPDEPEYFIIRQGRDAVGWMAQKGGPERRVDQMDWGLRTYGMTQLPNQPARVESRHSFIDRHFDFERWSIRIEITDGKGHGQVMIEKGLRQDQQVFAEAQVDDQFRSHTETLTPFLQSVYLPRLCAGVLPRLLDLDTPASYVFAEYSSTTDEFTQRSIQVAGPARIMLNGQTVEAIKIIDQPNFNDDTQVLYVDKEGRVLKVEIDGGYTRERTDRQSLLREFPDAGNVIRQLRKVE
jgi:hypothetical protein